MGQPAQVEKNRFVEQRADHETFGGNDWLGLRRDSGDLDLGDGLQRMGIGIFSSRGDLDMTSCGALIR